MKKVLVTMAIMALAVPAATMAQDAMPQQVLRMSDVTISYLPTPRSYQPDGTNYDLADQGKSFDVTCVINGQGHMQNCSAANNNMVDQNFVSRALDNVGQWVVDARALDGEPTAGKTFTVTCQFTRLADVTQQIASASPPR